MHALRAFWFVYFCGLGIFAPYYSLYLRENAGLSGLEVGMVLAVIPLVGIFAQPLWGQIADRTGARSRILVVLTLGVAAGLILLSQVSGFITILVVTAATAVFSTAVVPLTVSVSFAVLRDAGPHAFGFVRVWGTIGFLLLALSFPWLLDQIQSSRHLSGSPGSPSEPGLEMMFIAFAGFSAVAAAIGLFLPRRGVIALRALPGTWRYLLRHPPIVRLLFFNFVAALCLFGPIQLFPVFVRACGGDMQTVGRLWIFMLALEIPLVLLSGATVVRLGPRGLLTLGALGGGLRWAVCGFSQDLRVIGPFQVLHGLEIAGLVIGGPLYVETVVPESLRSTSQGLLAMGIASGAIVSNVVAGWLLQHVGTSAPYLYGGLGALTLAALSRWILLPAERRVDADSILE